MTRFAVIGDIHGNADALEAVLGEARVAGATSLVVLGDLIGYYYHPARVLDLLADWPSLIVRGNHENILGEWLTADEKNREALRVRYGSGFAACEADLPKSALDWLRKLPHPMAVSIEGKRALLGHGHPAGIDRYVYPDRVETALAEEDVDAADIVWLAHTHYPMDAVRAGVRICNPGSVGQPRDRDPRASWALWEPENDIVTWHRTRYDQTSLLAEIAKRDPEVRYLREVLTRTTERKS